MLHGFPGTGKGNIFKLNLYTSVVWLVMLTIESRLVISVRLDVLTWGILYGLTQALFVYFKVKAMGTGPVSITTLIGNSSLLISIGVSYIVWGESVTSWDLVGLLMLCTGIVLANYKKENEQYNPKWKFFVVGFFVFAAAVGLVFKAFGKTACSEQTNSMMLVSSVVMIGFYLILSLRTGGIKPEITGVMRSKKFLLISGCAGVLSCLHNRLNIMLSSKIDAIIFFPSFNGGVIILSSILSVLIYGEKLTRRQVVGICLGIAAVIVIGVL